MRQGKYLNVILTVNAVLLAGLLWTQVAEQPMLADSAVAQTRSRPNPGKKPSFYKPNASEQRADQLEVLKQLNQSIKEQTSLLSSGKLQVEVTNLDTIKVEVPDWE
jgi:hypothetical protein